MKIIIGLFFIAHVLVHAGLAASPNPDDPESKPGTLSPTQGEAGLLLSWDKTRQVLD